MIAHAIREQVCYARLNFDEAIKSRDLDPIPLRTEDQESWQPVLEEVDEEELERRLKEQERTNR